MHAQRTTHSSRQVRSGTTLLHPFALLERMDVRERMQVADLGCGSLGHFVFPAAELVGPKGVVYAVDILRDALAMVDRRATQLGLENIRTVWSDIESFGKATIPDGSLDVTLLVNNLFLTQQREAVVQEMARLTKGGGRVLLIDWKTTATPIGPPVDRRVSKEEARSIMTVPEFEPEDSFEAGPFHYGLTFRRTDAKVRPPKTRAGTARRIGA